MLLVRTAQRGQDFVEVAVHDRGMGVDETQLARIFDPFYTTKRTGMGLGLYITRAIVESHGGAISAAPGSERGLRVTVTLPIARAQLAYDQSPMPGGAANSDIR
jgi:signal transduction histidine kinase